MGAQNLEVPNWPNLEEIFMFWHHWAFSGTVWSLNPNFDTEIRKLRPTKPISGPSYGLKRKKRAMEIPDSIFWILDKKWEIFNFDEKLIWDHFLEAFRYADYEFRIPGAQKLIKMQFLAIFEKFEIFEKSRKSLGGGIGRRPFK